MSDGAVMTVLGVAPARAAAQVAAALGAGEMPPVAVCRAGAIAGFAVQGRAWPQARPVLRAALARAASASAFLPAEPCQALCDAAAWPGVIADAAGPLAEALSREGEAQQWEITIAASGHGCSAAVIATRLRAALLPHALGFRVCGVRSGLILKVLLPRGATPAVAGAVGSLSVAIEGPLPPLAFAAFRLERAESAAVSRAWALLALRDVADPAELARRWRGLAFALDPAPGRGRMPGRRLREAGRAYGLLRGLAQGLGPRPFRREEMLARCGSIVAVPAVRPATERAREMMPA